MQVGTGEAVHSTRTRPSSFNDFSEGHVHILLRTMVSGAFNSRQEDGNVSWMEETNVLQGGCRGEVLS
jgi:hypothetical protein